MPCSEQPTFTPDKFLLTRSSLCCKFSCMRKDGNILNLTGSHLSPVLMASCVLDSCRTTSRRSFWRKYVLYLYLKVKSGIHIIITGWLHTCSAKGWSKALNWRMTDNTMDKRKSTKGQTMIYKTLHLKLQLE